MNDARANKLPLTAMVAILACAIASPAAADTERERLDKGEILISQKPVAGSEMPESTVRAVVNVPPAKVWAFLDKCDLYKRYMPRTKASRELSRKGNIIVCEVTVDMPWPLDDLTSKTRAVHTVRPTWMQRKWSLISGNYNKNSGSWTVTPFDKAGTRSMVVYQMHAEPKVSIPKWIQRKASKSTLPGVIEAVRKATRHNDAAGR